MENGDNSEEGRGDGTGGPATKKEGDILTETKNRGIFKRGNPRRKRR